MAIKPTQPQQGPKVKDVDDAHADRHHGRKNEDVERSRQEKKQLTTPEQRAHDDGQARRRKEHVERKTPKRAEREKQKQKRDERGRDEEQQAPEEPAVKAGQLALDDNFNNRRHNAQAMGLDGTPGIDEFVEGIDLETAGDSLSKFWSARPRHPDLEEPEFEPPAFLKPLEAMLDIYMRVKGRTSRKTKELLEGVDLEDLIDALHGLFDDEQLVKKNEAKLRRAIYDQLKDGPGPLLLGLHDPRLTELWRLFIDGWDIWVPEGKETGVELFWEGEAEDDDGNVIELLQSLQYLEGEVALHARMGPHEDTITFDGEAFYRLQTVLD